MRGLAAERDGAVVSAVERHPRVDQRTYRLGAFAGEQQRPLGIDHPGTGIDRVGCVISGESPSPIAAANAALRIRAGAALRNGRLRQQQDRNGRQRERHHRRRHPIRR